MAGSPSAWNATVEASPWVETTGSLPVLSSRNAPVPYVHLASPGAKQAWPNSAACWSPIAAPMTTPGSTWVARPCTVALGRTCGSIARGTSNASPNPSSQSNVRRSISMVRLALVTSVTWTPPLTPPVRFHTSQVSIVPNSTSPVAARRRRSGDSRSSQVRRGAVAYVLSGSPHRSRRVASSTRRASSGSSGATRVSCQVIARPCGRPVCRSHSTAVSRWLAMPSATTSPAPMPALARAAGTTFVTLAQISAASCSTHPG